jgi:hypothetical protein
MSARIVFAVLFLNALTSCRKENFSSSHPMVGKWELKAVVAYATTAYIGGQIIPGICDPYNKSIAGDFSLEVTENARLIYSSRSGTETFRIVKRQERPFVVYYQTSADTDTIIGYNFTVKNGKGKKFQFKFFYDPVHQGLFGVAWYKGVFYNTFDQPIVAGTHYGGSYGNLPISGERLGLFIKY